MMSLNSPKNLLSNNKFVFTLTGERFNNNEFDLTVTDINLPGIQLGIINHGTHAMVVERPGDSINFNNISLEFLVTEEMTEWIILFKWLNDLRNFDGTQFDNSIVCDGNLIILSSKNNPTLGFTFTEMYPYDLGEIMFTQEGSGENVKCSVMFKFQNFLLNEQI
jgi:hypothetical protein